MVVSGVRGAWLMILALAGLMWVESSVAADKSLAVEEPAATSAATDAIPPVGARSYQPSVEPERMVKEIANTPFQTQSTGVEDAYTAMLRLQLPAPTTPMTMGAEAPGQPLKLGFNRPMSDFLDPSVVASQTWQWQTLADGERVTRIQVTSPGATALRIGLRIRNLPVEAELRFYSGQSGQGPAYQVAAKAVLQMIDANRLAMANTSGDPEIYWSPTLEGETAIVEIRLQAAADQNKVDVAIEAVSHLAANPTQANFSLQSTAASCNIDVNCYSTVNDQGQNIANAVARVVFTSTGGTFLCSGTLLADRADSGIPYFLTANHCISTASEASSVQTTWFYQSSACNSATQSASTQTLLSGATLLATYTNNDMTLLRLNDQPPSGAVYAGWYWDNVGDRYSAIHYPKGDWKKISFGVEDDLYSCDLSSGEEFSCKLSTTGGYLGFVVDKGVLEGGSSGSGIFKDNTYLVGTLTGGDAVCNNTYSFYGRFKTGYNNGLSKWLENSKTGSLENPQPSSYLSGITSLSGWACIPGVSQSGQGIQQLTVEIDGSTDIQAGYGTIREDTSSICGGNNNGWGLLMNMNRLGGGAHSLRALADGQEIGKASFTITTLGTEYLQGVSATYVIPNFPTANQNVQIQWQEHLQNFVMTARNVSGGQSGVQQSTTTTESLPELQPVSVSSSASATTMAATQASAALLGSLENPQPASYLSGITLFSGWVCHPGTTINRVDVEIDGTSYQASYGTIRPDTVSLCGGSNNGWGLLFNTNRLGDGQHTVRALVDGVELSRSTFTVTTLGVQYLQGASGSYRLMDFPKKGDNVVVTWQEHLQNFMIKEATVH